MVDYKNYKWWCFRAVPGASVRVFWWLRLFYYLHIKRFPPWRQQTGSGFPDRFLMCQTARIDWASHRHYAINEKLCPTHGEPLSNITWTLPVCCRHGWFCLQSTAVASSSRNTASNTAAPCLYAHPQLLERWNKLSPVREVNYFLFWPNLVEWISSMSTLVVIQFHPLWNFTPYGVVCSNFAPFGSSYAPFLRYGGLQFLPYISEKEILPPDNHVTPGWKCYDALTASCGHQLPRLVKIFEVQPVWSTGEWIKMMTKKQMKTNKYIYDSFFVSDA